jgi:hypothetical protein
VKHLEDGDNGEAHAEAEDAAAVGNEPGGNWSQIRNQTVLHSRGLVRLVLRLQNPFQMCAFYQMPT